MVGNFSHLPADKRAMVKITPPAGEGLFYLSKSTMNIIDTVMSLVRVKDQMITVKRLAPATVPSEVLFITGGDDAGYEKTITSLGNINILNSTFGDYLLFTQA